MFSSTVCLLLPVVTPIFWLGLCRGSLPALGQHVPGDTPAPQEGALCILPCPVPHNQGSHYSWGCWTLCCLPLLKGLFSNGPRANLALRAQSSTSLCSPEIASLSGRPAAWCQLRHRCQGKTGCFSGKVGAGLPLLTGRPAGFEKAWTLSSSKVEMARPRASVQMKAINLKTRSLTICKTDLSSLWWPFTARPNGLLY